MEQSAQGSEPAGGVVNPPVDDTTTQIPEVTPDVPSDNVPEVTSDAAPVDGTVAVEAPAVETPTEAPQVDPVPAVDQSVDPVASPVEAVVSDGISVVTNADGTTFIYNQPPQE